jgi:outer membrane murein-binding lipoprotein Lpp
MGRCAILLIAPVIIGVLIAAGVVAIDRVRQRLRRMNARRTLLEERRRALSPADPYAARQSADLTHRRIAA